LPSSIAVIRQLLWQNCHQAMRRIIPEEDYWAIKRGGWLGPFKLSPRREGSWIDPVNSIGLGSFTGRKRLGLRPVAVIVSEQETPMTMPPSLQKRTLPGAPAVTLRGFLLRPQAKAHTDTLQSR
jgi:hypothetical protein